MTSTCARGRHRLGSSAAPACPCMRMMATMPEMMGEKGDAQGQEIVGQGGTPMMPLRPSAPEQAPPSPQPPGQ